MNINNVSNNNTQIEEALRIYEDLKGGKYSEFERLLNERYDIDSFYFRKGSMLYMAIYEDNETLVSYLLEKGANPNKLYELEDGIMKTTYNAFAFAGILTEDDCKIFKKLIEANTWILPITPNSNNYTILHKLEEAKIQLGRKKLKIESIINHNIHINNENLTPSEENIIKQIKVNELTDENINNIVVQKMLRKSINIINNNINNINYEISLIVPYYRTYVKKIKISFLGESEGSSNELTVDTRISVYILKHLISVLFLNDYTEDFSFNLLMPRFRLSNKRIMNNKRNISDYGVQDNTTIVVVPIMSSQRHGGSRKKVRRKTQKARKN